MSDTEESGRRRWHAIYRVRIDGVEIGQTEQRFDAETEKPAAEVIAQLLDRLHCKNIEIGTFATHKQAEQAVIKAWQERNAPAGKEAA
jgi:hypothetical protein